MSVAMSNRPPLKCAQHRLGLLDYPWLFLEQTTSAATRMFFIDEEAVQSSRLKPHTREQRAKFIEGAIARIAGAGRRRWLRFMEWYHGACEVWLTPMSPASGRRTRSRFQCAR